jgi:murein DD-endopeptidase MepM/ murein hydrolase activator NlpD
VITPYPPDVASLTGNTPLGADVQSLRRGSPREVAHEFEAMLLAQMISAMRKTVPESSLLGSSPHRQVLDGVFDMEMARALSADDGLGLSEVLTRQLGLEEEKAGVQGAAMLDAHGHGAVGLQARTGATGAGAASDASDGGAEMTLPVRGRVSSGFGPRRHPVDGRTHFHSGIDVAAPRGSEIVSPAPGQVVETGSGGASGRFLRVRHGDGTVSSYAHLDRIDVREGDRITDGQLLGTVGTTGRSTGPHLHLSVYRDGSAVDPSTWLETVARART